MGEVLGILFVPKVLERIRPEKVAHGSKGGRLLEAVQFPDVVQGVDLGGEATVDAEELLVHEGGQGQAVERLHARVVHALRVLDLAWKGQKIKTHKCTHASSEIFKPLEVSPTRRKGRFFQNKWRP